MSRRGPERATKRDFPSRWQPNRAAVWNSGNQGGAGGSGGEQEEGRYGSEEEESSNETFSWPYNFVQASARAKKLHVSRANLSGLHRYTRDWMFFVSKR